MSQILIPYFGDFFCLKFINLKKGGENIMPDNEKVPEWKTKEWAIRVQAELTRGLGLFPDYISVRQVESPKPSGSKSNSTGKDQKSSQG